MRLFIWIVCLCFAGVCHAQVPGDHDGDGDVDGADFLALEPCLTGPQGSIGTGCLPFDFDATGTVDATDAAALQRAATGPIGGCTFGSNYAGGKLLVELLTGARAKVTTRPTKLCDEPDSGKQAASVAFVCVVKFIEDYPGHFKVEKWAQVGYLRHRSLPPLINDQTVHYKTYYEIRSGPGGVNRVVKFFPQPLAGDRLYECFLLIPATGRWFFVIDEEGYDDQIGTGWAGEKGNQVQYMAELHNAQDDMVGRASTKCKWSECVISVNNGRVSHP